MRTEIEITKVSVGQLINIYKGHSTEGNSAEFKIVIYRDQSDGDKIIEQFPSGSKFTRKYNTIEHFLNNILVNGVLRVYSPQGYLVLRVSGRWQYGQDTVGVTLTPAVRLVP